MGPCLADQQIINSPVRNKTRLFCQPTMETSILDYIILMVSVTEFLQNKIELHIIKTVLKYFLKIA